MEKALRAVFLEALMPKQDHLRKPGFLGGPNFVQKCLRYNNLTIQHQPVSLWSIEKHMLYTSTLQRPVVFGSILSITVTNYFKNLLETPGSPSFGCLRPRPALGLCVWPGDGAGSIYDKMRRKAARRRGRLLGWQCLGVFC